MSLSKLFVIFCPTVQDKVQNNEFPQSQFCLCGLFDAECMLYMCVWVGDLFIFPSNFMYPHRAMPVHSGTKYSIVTMLDYNKKFHTPEMYIPDED